MTDYKVYFTYERDGRTVAENVVISAKSPQHAAEKIELFYGTPNTVKIERMYESGLHGYVRVDWSGNG